MHVPYIKGATHHLINATNLKLCKPGVHLLNFARGEIIDGEAVRDMWRSGQVGAGRQGASGEPTGTRVMQHNSRG